MEIDKEKNVREYHIMHELLTKVEAPCMGKWFLEYRECFAMNLEEEENFEIDQRLSDQLFSLKWSLRDETAYFEYYKELDDAPMARIDATVPIKCTILTQTSIKQTDYTMPIAISYSDRFPEIDVLFSSWSAYHQKQSTSVNGPFTHENPCEYHTFWPDIGNIFYTFQKENRTYLFIKSGDGGGSGEFRYTIFVNKVGNHSFQPIMDSPGTNSLPPSYLIGYNKDAKQTTLQRISILDQYKNQPFVYKVYFEDSRRWIVSAIGKLLESSFE